MRFLVARMKYRMYVACMTSRAAARTAIARRTQPTATGAVTEGKVKASKAKAKEKAKAAHSFRREAASHLERSLPLGPLRLLLEDPRQWHYRQRREHPLLSQPCTRLTWQACGTQESGTQSSWV